MAVPGEYLERPLANDLKTLDHQMAVYAAYHRNPVNRLMHFVGVPLIMFSLLLALSWGGIPLAGVRVTAAMILTATVLAYYFVLDAELAAAMAVFTGLLLVAAHWLAMSQPAVVGWSVFAACFVGGWILQLVGHVVEGRRPALVDNLWQVFVAPIFLMAEVFFALGLKTEVKERVRVRLAQGWPPAD